MKRIRLIGLCLVAVFAFSVLVASAAQAAGPEYAKGCEKAKKETVEYKVGTKTKKKSVYTGKFTEKKCVAEAPAGKYREEGKPEGKYELESAVGVKITTSTGPVTLYYRGGEYPVVGCASSTGEGEITYPNLREGNVTFKGCKSASLGACKSEGAGAEEIKAAISSSLILYEGKAMSGFVGSRLAFTCGHYYLEATEGEALGAVSGNINEISKKFKTSSPFAVATFAVNAGHEQLPLGTGRELLGDGYNEETFVEMGEKTPVGVEAKEEVKSTTPLEVHL